MTKTKTKYLIQPATILFNLTLMLCYGHFAMLLVLLTLLTQGITTS